jgi:hypothetical protein
VNKKGRSQKPRSETGGCLLPFSVTYQFTFSAIGSSPVPLGLYSICDRYVA